MDFSSEQTSFDGWIVFRQLGGLLYPHTKNGDRTILTGISF
jgi:hypothetical protein